MISVYLWRKCLGEVRCAVGLRQTVRDATAFADTSPHPVLVSTALFAQYYRLCVGGTGEGGGPEWDQLWHLPLHPPSSLRCLTLLYLRVSRCTTSALVNVDIIS